MSANAHNLLLAYALACLDHARYQFMAKAARKDGYVHISRIFSDVAEQERAQAKRLLKLAGPIEQAPAVNLEIPALGGTAANLRSAADAEARKAELYAAHAQAATGDGKAVVAAVFNALSKAEDRHRAVFQALAELVDQGTYFSRPAPVTWQCLHCGFPHAGKQPPGKCPGCEHPQDHFAVAADVF